VAVIPRRGLRKVQAVLGDESVIVAALQMDKCCSFNLPSHNVVFNRIRDVDLDADERKLC
jgi:hypothetical protein